VIEATAAPSRIRASLGWMRANPLLTAGCFMVLIVAVVAIFAPLIAPYPGDAGFATHPLDIFKPPSAKHLFGTDNVGRDIFSRVVYGTRV